MTTRLWRAAYLIGHSLTGGKCTFACRRYDLSTVRHLMWAPDGLSPRCEPHPWKR